MALEGCASYDINFPFPILSQRRLLKLLGPITFAHLILNLSLNSGFVSDLNLILAKTHGFESPFDENIRRAVRKQTSIVDAYPSSPAAVAISQLAAKAGSWPIPAQPGGHLEFFIEQLIADKAVGSQR